MKVILIALLALTVGVGGVFAAGPLGDDASTNRTIPLSTADLVSSTTGTPEDIPGPCDEPEHANDPRCAGATTTVGTTTDGTTTNATTTTETRGRDAREPGEDVRGPCDEAEHANDPRCTGADGDDDRRGSNSGPGGSEDSGSSSSGHGGSDDDDRSGSNSGSG